MMVLTQDGVGNHKFVYKPDVIQTWSDGVPQSTERLTFSASINVRWGWGQGGPWQSGFRGLLWSSSSPVKTSRCVQAHDPAAAWVLFPKDQPRAWKHVSEECSGTSVVRVKTILWVGNAAVSFFPVRLLCYGHKSRSEKSRRGCSKMVLQQ